MTFTQLSKESKDEAVMSLAALVLFDAGAEITADKLEEVVAASGNSVEKYWPAMFAGLVAKTNVDALLKASLAPGSGGGAAAPAAGGAAKPAAAAKEEAKPKEEAAEVDVGGGNLFGGDKGKY